MAILHICSGDKRTSKPMEASSPISGGFQAQLGHLRSIFSSALDQPALKLLYSPELACLCIIQLSMCHAGHRDVIQHPQGSEWGTCSHQPIPLYGFSSGCHQTFGAALENMGCYCPGQLCGLHLLLACPIQAGGTNAFPTPRTGFRAARKRIKHAPAPGESFHSAQSQILS